MLPLTKPSCYKCQKVEVDRISALPDEILIFVLSLLTLREAATTCLLSSRWRNLWTYIGVLNFDVANKTGTEKYEKKPLRRRRQIFTNWVNKVLQRHQSKNIDKFRVFYDLDEKAAHLVDAWISFALASKVQNLELNLSEQDWIPEPTDRFYAFPCSLFSGERASSVKCLSLRACKLHPTLGFDCFKSLKTLSLKDVVLTEGVVENFISHCSLLEHLCVLGSQNLVNLKVRGGSLRLKYLEVYSCENLKDLEIYAPNLVSFKYEGPKISLSLKCGPKLVDICSDVLCGTSKDRMSNFVNQYQSCLFQLKTLTLGLTPMEVGISSKLLPVFSNLKILVLLVSATRERLTAFISLLKVSPILHRLELHLTRRIQNVHPEEVTSVSDFDSKDAHHFLKEVELSGFEGHAIDIEMATYLFRSAVNLDKFIVDPYTRWLCGDEWIRIQKKGILAVRECAKQRLLIEKPPNVVMTIL